MGVKQPLPKPPPPKPFGQPQKKPIKFIPCNRCGCEQPEGPLTCQVCGKEMPKG